MLPDTAESYWHENQKPSSSSARCAARGRDCCCCWWWWADRVSPTLLMQAKSNTMWNAKFSVSPFILCYLDVQAHTQRATGCVSYPSHVSKITSSGRWCNITRSDTVSALCVLVCEVSSQGLCWCVSDVCVRTHVGGREEEEDTDAWFTTVRPLGQEKKKNQPFKVSLSPEVPSHATQTQLCYRRALRAIYNVFCWWIKVEEAKYLAQIYTESLTLRTNHPWANPRSQSPQQKERERERGKVKEAIFKGERERGGGREQGWRRRESELRLWATLCIAGREGKTHGREGGREGGRLSLHSSKLHWVTHPLLQPWLHATSIKHLHPTGWRQRERQKEGERGYEIIVLRNCVIKA